jgi:hypothetical protein
MPGAFAGSLARRVTFSARCKIQKLPNFPKSLNGTTNLTSAKHISNEGVRTETLSIRHKNNLKHTPSRTHAMSR